MSLIKIKQINNTPANTGDVITFNGTNNVWAPTNALQIVTSFVGLPGSPTTNDVVFYMPFQTLMVFDGTDWVGPKTIQPMFSNNGRMRNSTWMETAGGVNTGIGNGGNPIGLLFPAMGSVGAAYNIYGFSGTNSETTTSSMELHNTSTASNPVFGTTGIGQVASITAAKSFDLTFSSPDKINSGDVLQCFWRRVSGDARDFTLQVTYALVATA